MPATLEDIFNEYKKIKEAHLNNEISTVHMQGALAYLEIKSKEAGIIFVAPEINRYSKNYITPANSPSRDDIAGLDQSEYEEEISEESSEYVTPEEILTPTTETSEGDREYSSSE